MRKLVVVVAAAAAALSLTASAGADSSQSGCQAYGAFLASAAQGGGIGGIVSGVATSGPGAVAATSVFLRQLTCSS